MVGDGWLGMRGISYLLALLHILHSVQHAQAASCDFVSANTNSRAPVDLCKATGVKWDQHEAASYGQHFAPVLHFHPEVCCDSR
jgi:hypothetical protein